jgi:hypothetical protein
MTKKKQVELSQIIVLHPDGTRDIHMLEELDGFKARKLVGGYVQVVPVFRKFEGMSCVVLCDEDGKMTGKPYNVRATLEWKRCAGGHDDMLVGDVVVVTGPARRKWG